MKVPSSFIQPKALRNSQYSSAVTNLGDIQYLLSVTGCAGRSSERPLPVASPMRKVCAGIQPGPFPSSLGGLATEPTARLVAKITQAPKQTIRLSVGCSD